MASLPSSQDLHNQVANILAIPSLSSYARALSLVEDVAELALASSTHNPTSSSLELLRDCKLYEMTCRSAIAQLTDQASRLEHETYERAKSASVSSSSSSDGSGSAGDSVDGFQQRRRGVIFGVDRGEHVAAALEALRLEEFLLEQERQQSASDLKKVRWADMGGRRRVC
ncbi:hypothetical protein HD806DRAFT_549997 [Xylariaceae sp. AK1471]|nr:hypothetical protein HD806DRAFT_549997 [Xylariaceae sp. AK1471]